MTSPVVFGDSISRLLVVLHALTGTLLIGTAGHLVYLAWLRLSGRPVGNRLLKHSRIAFVSLGLVLTLGLLAYPHYRYHVRALIFDRDAPWASNLFDLKENAGAFGFAIALVLWRVEQGGAAPRLAAIVALTFGLLMAFSMIAGLIVNTVVGT